MKSRRDRKQLEIEFAGGAGAKIEDTALQCILRVVRLPAADDLILLSAIREAILDSWEAGWEASRGDAD